ncbi:MAG: rRNA pseudouridine synthase [bacterium]|nr:rRNA pseudouridine synthase [bacterium]
MVIRIQKYLSEKGILSRRKAEEYLKKGWIIINGKVATETGIKIDPEKDEVKLAPEIYEIKKNYCYLIFNKPAGILTNCPGPGEKEITDLLPKKYQHLNSIGRLDKDSSGLIIMTDDGILAKSILNSKNKHEREYEVVINKPLTNDMKISLEEGVFILGSKTLPVTIKKTGACKFIITMKEGRNRQIRRMLRSVYARVVSLKRIRFGNIKLDKLKTGHYRQLNKAEINGFL